MLVEISLLQMRIVDNLGALGCLDFLNVILRRLDPEATSEVKLWNVTNPTYGQGISGIYGWAAL